MKSLFDQRTYQRARKQRLKALGICQDCGQAPPKLDRTLCQRCITNRTNYLKGLPLIPGTKRPHRNEHQPQRKPVMEDTERIDRMLALAARLA